MRAVEVAAPAACGSRAATTTQSKSTTTANDDDDDIIVEISKSSFGWNSLPGHRLKLKVASFSQRGESEREPTLSASHSPVLATPRAMRSLLDSIDDDATPSVATVRDGCAASVVSAVDATAAAGASPSSSSSPGSGGSLALCSIGRRRSAQRGSMSVSNAAMYASGRLREHTTP